VTRKCDPVGAVEIAARLGVKRDTVDQWRQRSIGFPAPRWQVGGRPAWNWDDVEAWHRARRPSIGQVAQP
jgi:predicted DNA-binding transcriptional regulator AlpA